jgi:hypothetical protein
MFKRMPLLSPEVEVKLAEEMLPLWDKGFKAKEIAEELNFGRGDYAKLKTLHVWFYRLKFNDARYEHLKEFKGQFQRRKKGIAKGKSRYKEKFDETMSFSEFKSLLNQNAPVYDNDEVMMKRAYFILHYWTPLRKSEILERVRRDFKVKREFLVINLYRKKKHYGPNAKPEPYYLLLELPLVDEVVEWIKKFKSNEHPFNITPLKAWYWAKETFDGRYPHYFRFDYITKAVENAEDARTILSELLDDTRMDITTVTGYVMASSKHRAAISKRELELINKERAQR